MSADVIVGFGEVGSAIHEVLSERREFAIHDPPKGFDAEPFEADWCHIAIPYTKDFIANVTSVVTRFQPTNVVLHSTLPVGTTREVEKALDYAADVYFSPVRGRHPNLASALRRFPKYYASSISGELDTRFESYFAQAGIQTRKAPNFEVLELMKIWETTSFAVNLIMWAEIENEMRNLPGHLPANMTAMKNWLFEKRRVYDGDIGICPVLDLVPGPLGGHCLRSNIELAREYFHPSLYEWLISIDDSRKK